MGLWKAADSRGQSLVEILVAVAVVTVVLVTLVAAVVIAVRGVRFSKEKIKANFLAQEALEWIRTQRDSLGWVDFAALATPTGTKYCLESLNFDSLGSCSESQKVETIFTREVVLTSGSGVTASVEVKWDEGGKEFGSDVETTLYQWETD